MLKTLDEQKDNKVSSDNGFFDLAKNCKGIEKSASMAQVSNER